MAKTHTTRVSRASALGDRIPVGQSCLVVIYGPGLGRRYELGDGEITIGREVGSTIHVDLDNVSRRHAKLLWRDGKICIKDLGSTNGTYLNDEEIDRRSEVPLRSGDLVKVGSGIFKFLYGGDVESLFHEEIYRITIMDGLTQVYNKRYFMEFLEREMARGLRYGRPLSLMMIDVDHFKEVNDRHGHLAGDAVLRELAMKVKSKVRREECLARFGGEEFALVTPESGPDKARKFAEKIRATVEAQKFVFDGKPVSVTVSIGIADMTPEFTEPELFIRSADEKLYVAKEQGRNRVVG
jgi:two-component system, cell cycle response regulator